MRRPSIGCSSASWRPSRYSACPRIDCRVLAGAETGQVTFADLRVPDAARADHPAGDHLAKEAIVQTRVPAVFMRGGTSRAIVFHERDLAPYSEAERTAIVLAAMGSPDPYGRQVDGLGGGISSLSKIAIVGVAPPDADVDVTFTFGQVEVTEPRIDWIGTCGNISAAVPVFAVEEGLVPATEPVTPVRVL